MKANRGLNIMTARNVFFQQNYSKPAAGDTKRSLCKVGVPGDSLFPALAAAWIDRVYSNENLSKKQTGILLHEYLNSYPTDKRSLNAVSPLKQWQSMLKSRGAAAKVSLKLASVFKDIACKAIQSNPEQYCRGIADIENFDAQMAYRPEKLLYIPICAALASYLDTEIQLRIVDGAKTLPANLYFHDSDLKISITLDKSSDEFKPEVKRTDKFSSMAHLASPQTNAILLDSSDILRNLQSSLKKIMHRYTIMWEAGEIDQAQLMAEYINQSNEASIPYIRIPPIASEASTLPANINLLVQSIAWLESTKASTFSDLTNNRSDSARQDEPVLESIHAFR